MNTLLSELDAFVADSGLSEHRVGILLAKNGRLIPRLRDGGRIWPDTEKQIRRAIRKERAARNLAVSGAASLEVVSK